MIEQVTYQKAQAIMFGVVLNALCIYVLATLHTQTWQSRKAGMFIKPLIQTGCIVIAVLLYKPLILLQIQTWMLAAVCVVGVCFSAYRLMSETSINSRRGSRSKTGFVLFVLYTAAIIYSTLISRLGGRVDSIVLSPVRCLQLLLYEDPEHRIPHLLLNIALFVPFGFLLPTVNQERLNRMRYATAGMLLTAFIESVQLIFRIGECDLMDLVGNTLGTACGLAAYIFADKRGLVKWLS